MLLAVVQLKSLSCDTSTDNCSSQMLCAVAAKAKLLFNEADNWKQNTKKTKQKNQVKGKLFCHNKLHCLLTRDLKLKSIQLINTCIDALNMQRKQHPYFFVRSAVRVQTALKVTQIFYHFSPLIAVLMYSKFLYYEEDGIYTRCAQKSKTHIDIKNSLRNFNSRRGFLLYSKSWANKCFWSICRLKELGYRTRTTWSDS